MILQQECLPNKYIYMEIRTDGYYLSGAFHWIDWQASIKLEGDIFYVLKFNTNKCFFDTVNDPIEIDLDGITKKENFGLYRIYENKIEILYNPNTKFELKRLLTIFSPEILLDENLKEYKFVEHVLV
jgi:hypothetical protein